MNLQENYTYILYLKASTDAKISTSLVENGGGGDEAVDHEMEFEASWVTRVFIRVSVE